MISIEELKIKLSSIIDPTSNKTLGEINGIKHVGIDEEANKVVLLIGLLNEDEDLFRKFRIDAIKLLKGELGFSGVKLEIEPLNSKDAKTNENEKKIKYIAIASGKGGVGKSTVTANLAVTFARLGYKVGIIDADIYGPSIPNVLDMPKEYPKGTSDKKVIPHERFNVQVISTDFFIEDSKPLMWRGPMLGKMLNHFFYDVQWDEDIEYIFVDLPPGTGDVPMDIQTIIPECELIVVTTPHPSAADIAVRAGLGAKQLNHKIIGVVENMAYFTNPVNSNKEYIFGQGGGKLVSEKLGVDIFSSIPIGQPSGNHHSIFALDEEIGLEYLSIAKKLIKIYN